jgi:hypothetical protein
MLLWWVGLIWPVYTAYVDGHDTLRLRYVVQHDTLLGAPAIVCACVLTLCACCACAGLLDDADSLSLVRQLDVTTFLQSCVLNVCACCACRSA